MRLPFCVISRCRRATRRPCRAATAGNSSFPLLTPSVSQPPLIPRSLSPPPPSTLLSLPLRAPVTTGIRFAACATARGAGRAAAGRWLTADTGRVTRGTRGGCAASRAAARCPWATRTSSARCRWPRRVSVRLSDPPSVRGRLYLFRVRAKHPSYGSPTRLASESRISNTPSIRVTDLQHA